PQATCSRRKAGIAGQGSRRIQRQAVAGKGGRLAMTAWLGAGVRLWAGWMWPMFWQASILILLIAIVDRLIRRWAWPQVRLLLWSLVLVKPILPPTLASPVSLTSGLFSRESVPIGLERIAPESLNAASPAPKAQPLLALDLLDGPAPALRRATGVSISESGS